MTRVLLVDDKEENLYYLQVLLEATGYEVKTARHGAEALVMARQSPPDLIVSDLLMPVMDGYTLLRHWKADVRLNQIPFIVYTATYTDQEDKALALSLGADAFILKPCDPEVFVTRLHAAQTAFHAASPAQVNTPEGDESVHLRYYSEVLIRKLEDKMLQLEEINRVLNEDIVERKRVEASLSLFVSAVEQSHESIIITDAMLDFPGPKIVFVNPAFTRMTGYTLNEALGKTPRILQGPNTDREVIRYLRQRLEAGEEFEGRAINYRKDGTEYFQEWQITPIRDGIGNVTHHLAVMRDITERHLAEAALLQSETRIKYMNRVYAMLSGINSLIVRVKDREQLYTEACRIAVETGGFCMAMIGIYDHNVGHIVPVASVNKDEHLLAAIKQVLSSDKLAANTMIMRAFSEKKVIIANDSQADPRVIFAPKYIDAGVRSLVILPLLVAGEPVGVFTLYASEIEFFHEQEVQLLTELTEDIAFAIDHIDQNERLQYLAYYDALTGLANRSLFLERVGQFVRSADSGGYKLGLFILDLERFKNINDSLGRVTGDALLKQVAEWLTRTLGGANLFARVDGDRFAMVMPEVRQDGEVARQVEKTLSAFLEHVFQINDTTLRLSAKIGVALFPDDGAGAETVFNHAESALKKAKKSGDRYLFHTKNMTEAVAAKLDLENQLRNAIDNEEFVLHYQPKVDLASGEVIGAEALIRWNDPRNGLVPPGKFIPILEETGLINEVGRWALGKAVEDYVRWHKAGLAAVRIAVNVSPLQLGNPTFVDDIKQRMLSNPLAAQALELEITESMVMDDVKRSVSCLRNIRDLGFTIAIDDFGTGFSSLGYLSKLPVDTLKIDRSFIMDMTAGTEGLALVSTIITLAHALKLKVVAEGVETEEQSDLLRQLQCDQIQGFLFSKPVPADIFEANFLR